jgi:hypothetical protein
MAEPATVTNANRMDFDMMLDLSNEDSDHEPTRNLGPKSGIGQM